MADIKVTGSANFSAVTNGLKKIGAESANAAKGTMRAGQSILSLSQGIEDFAAAGIRGAMNNIPVLIQQLGAGAGLAGAASIALVAINELVKGLDRLLDKRREALEREAGRGFGYKSLALTNDELKQIEKNSAKAIASLASMQEQFQSRDSARSSTMQSFEARSAVGAAREIFELEKQGASEQDKKLASIRESIKLINAEKSRVSESIREQRLVPGAIQDQINKEQEAIDKWKEMEKSIEAAYAAARKAGRASIDPFKGFVSDRTTGKLINIPKSSEEISAEHEANIRAAIAAVNAGLNESEISAAKIAAGLAEKKLEALKKQQSEAQKLLRTAEDEARVSQVQLDSKKAQLDIDRRRAERDALQGFGANGIPILGALAGDGMGKLMAIAEKAFGKTSEDAPWMRPMNGANMLSSSGRIGGSGAEYNSAVATVNYQREALKELRAIARNTRKGSTYN